MGIRKGCSLVLRQRELGQPANHCRSHLEEQPARSLFSYTRDNFQESLKQSTTRVLKGGLNEKSHLESCLQVSLLPHSSLSKGRECGRRDKFWDARPNDESSEPLNPAQGRSTVPEAQVLPADSSDRKTRVPDCRGAKDGGKEQTARLISSRPHRRAKPGSFLCLFVSAH